MNKLIPLALVALAVGGTVFTADNISDIPMDERAKYRQAFEVQAPDDEYYYVIVDSIIPDRISLDDQTFKDDIIENVKKMGGYTDIKDSELEKQLVIGEIQVE